MSGRGPGRYRGGRMALLTMALGLLPLLAACHESRPLPSCPDDEDAAVQAGTILPEHQARGLSDPTAGGVLSGRPAAALGSGRPRKMILLLDYSGSMFGGYGKPQVTGCPACAAGLDQAGRPVRHGQPYYVGSPDFRQFLAAWLDAATPVQSDMGLEVLLFNGCRRPMQRRSPAG
jgi:hypothetical protein